MKPSDRFIQQSKHATINGAIAILISLVCGAYAGVAHANQDGVILAALAVGLLLALFIAVTQLHEAVRCLRLSRQWRAWESETSIRL